MATKTKPAVKAEPKPEPFVESADVQVGDACVVLSLDGAEYRLSPVAVAQLRRDFAKAHLELS